MTLPAVPESFSWTSAPCGLVLTCRPLEAVAPHLFTTRDLELSSAHDWQRIAGALGAEDVATLTQVHGRDVVALRRGTPRPAGRPPADALVSDDPAVAIAVRAADCVPLLLADPATRAVAAVHAGWRGTAAGAAIAAVETLQREFGARPGDLVAAIGPSIGACCYEVGEELIDAFIAAGQPRDLIDRWFVRRDPGSGIRDPGAGIRDPGAGIRDPSGLRLDLAAATRDQLVCAGVPDARIHACGLCTAMHLDILTSFRAEKAHAGRIAAAIRCRA